jgi:CRISPR-associated protein Csc2
MENQILGIFGGISELPSSLELVQTVYDEFASTNTPLEHPLDNGALIGITQKVISSWIECRGISVQLSGEELTSTIAEIDRHWSDAERETFLRRLDESYQPFRQVNEKKSKNKKKEKETAEAGS